MTRIELIKLLHNALADFAAAVVQSEISGSDYEQGAARDLLYDIGRIWHEYDMIDPTPSDAEQLTAFACELGLVKDCACEDIDDYADCRDCRETGVRARVI